MESERPPVSTPIEIWEEILRFATLIPGALDTSPQNSLDYYEARRSAVVQECRKSMKVKNTLSKVCRRWRGFVIGYLFEVLIIDLDAHEMGLPWIDAIIDSNVGLPNPFRFVRRLEIYSRTSTRYVLKAAVKPLLRMIQSTQGLIIYRQSLRELYHSQDFVDSVLSACSDSLRYIVLEHAGIPRHLGISLAPMKRLEHIAISIDEEFVVFEAPHPLYLPNLHTLELHPPSRFSQFAWESASFQCCSLRGTGLTTYTTLPPGVASQITTLHVDDGAGDDHLNSLPPETTILRVLMPGLWAPHAWTSMRSCALQQIGLTLLDHETRFATQTIREKETLRARQVAAFTALANRQVFPFLAVIRCCNFRSDDLMRPGDWPKGVYEVHPRHVRIEEPDGTLVVLPPLG